MNRTLGRLRRVLGRQQVVDAARALVGVLGQGPADDRPVRLGQLRQIGPRRQVLHQDLADRLALERHPAGEHLVEDHADGVDVDRLVVLARGDLGGHVVAGADALGVLGPLAGGDQLGQAVVADLDDPLFHEQVGRLQVAVDDAVVVEVGDALDQPLEPGADLVRGQAPGVLRQDVGQARAGDVLHDRRRCRPRRCVFRS